jgi:hypothetical protein
MKLSLVFLLALAAATTFADNQNDVLAQLVLAQEQAQARLSDGTNLASPLLTGTWTFTKRMCVSGFSKAQFENPSQVFDISNYYNVLNFSEATERFTTTNADKLGNHCVSQATGTMSSVLVNATLNGLTVTEVIAVQLTKKQKLNCSDAYKGPSLAKIFNVVKVDDNTAYFFLLPGQLPGSPVSCANPNDFNLDLAVRIPDVN